MKTLSKNETIKEQSRGLRGTIHEGLRDASTGAVSEDDTQLLKFHGIYQQDDRDLRTERRRAGEEKAYSFMARVRVPGGVCTPSQWLTIDRLADSHANGSIKITTRQAFQLHGILKGDLRDSIHQINQALLDTLAACGDVNRNVMGNPNPSQSGIHAEVYAVSREISAHLSPRTRAYHEIWVEDRCVAGGEEEDEPIYGKTYLPRKFKIAIAVPPSNDVDIYAQDLGFIAILEEGRLAGFNVVVGGGMGMSHNQIPTYPRLAEPLGFCTREQVVEVAEKVVLVQRDYGDRSDRKHARLKYTIEDRGIEWFRKEVESRLGYPLGGSREVGFSHTGDRYGWVEGENGNWHYTLFIENGRIRDTGTAQRKSGLRRLAEHHRGDFRLTPNQNLIIANVSPAEKTAVEEILDQHGLRAGMLGTALRLHSMACVALPTCGLALAEGERYLPDLVSELDAVIEEAGLHEDAITIRMTGCPNGCARPYLGEIGLVGRAPGKYNVYLGAAFNGTRMNALYRASVPQNEITALLVPIIKDYAKQRLPGERFGDFVIRQGLVAPANKPEDFHETKAGAGSRQHDETAS